VTCLEIWKGGNTFSRRSLPRG